MPALGLRWRAVLGRPPGRRLTPPRACTREHTAVAAPILLRAEGAARGRSGTVARLLEAGVKRTDASAPSFSLIACAILFAP